MQEHGDYYFQSFYTPAIPALDQAVCDFSRGIHDGVDHDLGRLGFGESAQRRAIVLALAVEVVTEDAGLDGVCSLGGVALQFGDLGDRGKLRLDGRLGHDTRADAHRRGIEEAAFFQGGVDTDHEMQTLLLIEKAYTANAKVISVVNDLLQRLLEI